MIQYLRENDEEAYEEEATTSYHFSSEGKQETAMEPTIVEAVTSLEFPNKEEMETDFAPMKEEVQKSHALTPYIPPHRRFEASDGRKDKNLCSKYKTQKAMPRHKHIHMLEMRHHSNKRCRKQYLAINIHI